MLTIHSKTSRDIRATARPGVKVTRGGMVATVSKWIGARYVTVAYPCGAESTWKLGEFEIA